MKKVRVPYKQVEAKLFSKFKGEVQHIGQYSGKWATTKFKCLRCGKENTSTFAEKLKSKTGCTSCGKLGMGRLTHAEFVSAVKSRNTRGDFQFLGKYIGLGPIKTKCLNCGHIWSPRTSNLLNCNSGCPECAKYSSIRFDFKDYKLGDRTVRVQGYENFALDWLCSTKGVNPKDIQVFSDRSIEEVRYKYKGRWRTYRPDFQVGDTLYEVKSVWTLTYDFKQNVAKALACIDSGYKHKMLVASPDKTVQLPSDWVKKRPAFLTEWLRKKTQRPLTILALDPGTKNFGWSILRAVSAKNFVVLETGMMENTIKDLKTDVSYQAYAFRSELESLVLRKGVSAIAVERFMTRGVKGATIEYVNIMIGAVLARMNNGKRKLLLLPASQWKNEFNRHSSLERFYKLAKGCTVHQLDSVGIGIYASYHWFGVKPFTDFNDLMPKVAKSLSKLAKGT